MQPLRPDRGNVPLNLPTSLPAQSDNLGLATKRKSDCTATAVKEDSMQQGSIIRSSAKMAPPSGCFGGQKLDPRDSVFTASEWSEQLKNMPPHKQFVTPSKA